MFIKMKSIIGRCTDILSTCFETLFGREELGLKTLLSRGIGFWQSIAKPQTLHDGTITIFPYDHKMVKEALFYIKNKHRTDIIGSLTSIVRDFLLEELAERAMMDNFVDPLIVAIPTTRVRALRRGYNPSEIIAHTLASGSESFTHIPRALEKTRESRSQKTLSRSERLANIRNSMTVSQRHVATIRSRCVIVVDDIVTTGATLQEARRALLESGARKVLCLALAH